MLKEVEFMKEYCKLHKKNHTLIFIIMRLWETKESGENIEMRVECEQDMDVYAEFTLPTYHCHHAYGFKETELMEIKNFLKDNAVLIWDMAREVGYFAKSSA